MRTERPTSGFARKRIAGVALGVTLVLTVFVVGLAFANALSARRVADNAASLHWTNAAVGTSALARAALVQATTYVELNEVGLVPSDDMAAAMEEVEEARRRLGDLHATGRQADSNDELGAFLDEVDGVLAALGEGDHDLAKELLMSGLEPGYVALVGAIQAEQGAIQGRIDANTEVAGRVTDFLRFLLTLGIPATAVLVYRFIARRQVREMRLKTDLELEKERAVGRAKDEFIAGLSHELKTPLTSIYGFAEVLSDGGTEDAASAAEMAQIIANEAAEMNRMVDDLLAAARLESTGLEVEVKQTRVSEVVESAALPFERAGLQVDRRHGDVVVPTDPARLRHVLVNLISNAAQHGGSQIGIEVSTGDGVVDIEVWDTGPGVPEDRLPSLFDTFIHNGRATLMTGTLGLGLGVASRICELLGGRLKYQRFAGKTYFIVTLPLSESDGRAEPVAVDVDDAESSVAATIRAMSA